jgi:hypothetical protein
MRPTLPPAVAGACVRSLALAAIASIAVTAQAGVPTVHDCLDGSDFVANAARSRDNGMSRDAFLARMEEDFVVIRSFPPALRWFVKDDDDERFLLDAAASVYDRPQAPAQHHADFLAVCLQRLSA